MSNSFYDADPDNDSFAGATSSFERIVARVAADPLLVGAVASMGLALGLELAGRPKAARIVGLWAPTLLLFGLYRQGAAAGDDETRRQSTTAREREERFQGGCSAPPHEFNRSRSVPHKAK